jgi:HD-GYP domain-containing protein (c-di-GMP phosphodiesterase class II)
MFEMPMISIAQVKPGMILAKPICRPKDGLILLQNNIELKQSYIEKIKALNLDSIWVQEGQELDEAECIVPIKEEPRFRATSILRTTFSQMKEMKNIDIVKLKDMVKEIIDYILNDSRIVYTLTKLNAYDNYTFTHSVDVCVLSVLIGSIMNLKRNELEILGISSLLHDIGKTHIDVRVLNKPFKLNMDEYEQIKTHTRGGYELLRTRSNVSFLVPHMALQHHEREDGSGYPRGLSSKRIHRFAKIIAVADVFDAMTSHRIYQNPVPASAAIQEICENTPSKYSKEIVEHFIKIVAPYSKGSILLLNNQQTVEVVSVSRVKCLIKVIAGLNEGEIYNLYQKPELSIIKWVC